MVKALHFTLDTKTIGPFLIPSHQSCVMIGCLNCLFHFLDVPCIQDCTLRVHNIQYAVNFLFILFVTVQQTWYFKGSFLLCCG